MLTTEYYMCNIYIPLTEPLKRTMYKGKSFAVYLNRVTKIKLILCISDGIKTYSL